MCTFIKMEYLVANALVELCERKNKRQISIDEIKAYGIKVEEMLINENIRTILLYSNQFPMEFIEDYSDFFTFDGNFIMLKDEITPDHLRNYILSRVPIDILLAMLNENTLQVILG